MGDDLKFCNLCNQYLSRWTVLRHQKYLTCLNRQPTEESTSRRRRRRLSSGEDGLSEEITARENGFCEEMVYGSDQRDAVFESTPCQVSQDMDDPQSLNDPGETGIEEQEHWDDEAEEDINRDLADNQEEEEKDKEDRATNIINWILCSLMFIQCKFNLSDKCVEVILLLFKQLFVVLGVVNILCFSIASVFPVTLYMFRKFLQFDRDDFAKLIVCPNCTAVYRFGEVVRERDGVTRVMKCTNRIFGCRLPSNNSNKGKHGKYRCDADLMQKIKLKNKEKYYPLKVFCYKNVINTLELFLSRPDFEADCNKWRHRTAGEFYGDIYDGNVWHEFQEYQGQPLLSQPNNYAAMINVDWFQPFKRRSDYSVGVIYLVFLNLPRSIRFKIENVCLLGIIPAMKKEPENLNSFLGPIVKELQILSRGIQILPKGKDPVTAKLHLLCAASDIPAARKLSGHMGHAAIKGCSFCGISFRDQDGNKYVGPVDPKWCTRTRAEHIHWANKAENAESYTQQKLIQKKSGYKFTKLLDLPYFIPSKFSVVEPMHNLFLGTAKKCFCYWVDNDFLSKLDLETVGERVSKMKVSSDLGRLPTNIASNHGQFTAEEWKNWVLVYSLYCLQGLLPTQHLKAWQKFVLACRIICQPAIPKQRLQIAHRLFLNFSKDVEQLYGPEFLTPNIHLHGHLKETIENYGSLYGFWAFSFERYNGILADFPTNKRSIEIQIMRKFQQLGFTADLQYKTFGEDLNVMFTNLGGDKDNKVYLSFSTLLAPQLPVPVIEKCVWQDLTGLSIKHAGYKLVCLPNAAQDHLLCVYRKMYGDDTINREAVTTVAKQYLSVHWNNELLGSILSCRRENSSIVLAKWAADDSTIDDQGMQRPGIIKHFIHHSAVVNDKITSHLFVVVDWYIKSEDQLGFLPPVSVWSSKQMNDGPATFLPIQRIHSRCAIAKEKRGAQSYIVVSAFPARVIV